MKVYQVEASKLHASAVFSVMANNIDEATKELYSLMASVGMSQDTEVSEL